MWQYILPAMFTLFIWWLSTGVILYLDGLPRKTYSLSIYASSVLLGDALIGLWFSRHNTSLSSAYIAFTCAIMVWAWVEMAFLMGYVTGSRKTVCPLNARGWHKAWLALQTLWHHEIALLVLGATITLLTWGAENQLGVWTFLTLYVMRLSAKLNVFLGVRNLNESFLPEHLRYLGSYFTKKWMNPLFPLSVSLSTFAAAAVWQAAFAPYVSPFQATALTFTGMLLSLAVLEHWFLVLPLPAERLWNWSMHSRAEALPPAQKITP
jgi:putative photosynthetic complex assembly protein 2